MSLLDWIVLFASLAGIVGYGLYKGRGSDSVQSYLLADKSMPWWAMGLSIMATQASAITFIGTTGQGYSDGMRFVQFYFGLPLAMILIAAFVVPMFHRSGVVTAYEFIERRFDAKTRVATTIIFLIQRGLGAGLALYAPAVVLSVILGWPERVTVVIMAVVVLAYAVPGGIKAVTWTDVQQMMLIFLGVIAAFTTAVVLLPKEVSFTDALYLAGASGRLNAVDLSFDLQNRYNIWSGLIGGMFLALSYFGCDQSQVQRYLTGKSIAHSRQSLIFNAIVKLPLQFFILLTGAMVFAFYLFAAPPMLFNHVEFAKIQQASDPAVMQEYQSAESNYQAALDSRRKLSSIMVQQRHGNSEAQGAMPGPADLRAANAAVNDARKKGVDLLKKVNGGVAYDDTNYIFLTFVMKYFPAGLIGLVIAAIFAAAMSTISAELNSLATSTTIDLYRRFLKRDATDRHYVLASKLGTVFWGVYAGVFAFFGGSLGSLIEAINMVGSLFYGSLLGVFMLAFAFKRATGTGAFIGLIVGEIAVLATWKLTTISFLWYNLVGCAVVVAVGLLISGLSPRRADA
jgi:SSS family transporter